MPGLKKEVLTDTVDVSDEVYKPGDLDDSDKATGAEAVGLFMPGGAATSRRGAWGSDEAQRHSFLCIAYKIPIEIIHSPLKIRSRIV